MDDYGVGRVAALRVELDVRALLEEWPQGALEICGAARECTQLQQVEHCFVVAVLQGAQHREQEVADQRREHARVLGDVIPRDLDLLGDGGDEGRVLHALPLVEQARVDAAHQRAQRLDQLFEFGRACQLGDALNQCFVYL